MTSQGSVITDEMKKLIGQERDTAVFEIEKEPIRRWADAIGDSNPLYHDEDYAKAHGYRSLIAPPGFMSNYAFPVKRGRTGGLFFGPFRRTLNGGNEYEMFKAIQAGDTIAMSGTISEIFEREGRLGKMMFVVQEYTYKNQMGETVAKAKYTGIYY